MLTSTKRLNRGPATGTAITKILGIVCACFSSHNQREEIFIFRIFYALRMGKALGCFQKMLIFFLQVFGCIGLSCRNLHLSILSAIDSGEEKYFSLFS